MKSLSSLIVLFLSLAYVTQVRADFQSGNVRISSQLSAKEDKIYVPLEKLHFSKEGIFLLTKRNLWASVNQLGYDSSGYYLAGSRLFPGISSFIAICNYCGFAYCNRTPQPCENCNRSEGYDIEYEDIWDRG